MTASVTLSTMLAITPRALDPAREHLKVSKCFASFGIEEASSFIEVPGILTRIWNAVVDFFNSFFSQRNDYAMYIDIYDENGNEFDPDDGYSSDDRYSITRVNRDSAACLAAFSMQCMPLVDLSTKKTQ